MLLDILGDFVDFFRIQFESAFVSIPVDNVAASFYVIGNFVLQILLGFAGGGGIGPGDLLP